MGQKQEKAIQFKIELGNKTDKLFDLDPETEEYKSLKKEIEKDEKTLKELAHDATLEWLKERGVKDE